MNAKWKNISAEEAARHPLYGVKNWLAVFAFGVLFNLLRDIGGINSEAIKAGISLEALLAVHHPAITFLKSLLVVEALSAAAICWAMFTKHPKFRTIASWVLLGSWPLEALIWSASPNVEVANVMVPAMFQWVIGCAIWVTYLQRSRRVRVTFEHQIQADSVLVPAPSNDANLYSSSGRVSSNILPPTGQPAVGPVKTPVDSLPPTPSFARSSMASGAQRNTTSLSVALSPQFDESSIYLAIGQEIESNRKDIAVWTKAFADSEGDEGRAKAFYIRERFARLAAQAKCIEVQSRVDEDARKERQQIEFAQCGGNIERLAEEARSRNDNEFVTVEERQRMEFVQRIKRGPSRESVRALKGTNLARDFFERCRQGRVNEVKIMLGENPALVGITDREENSGLHIAVRESDFILVKLLVEEGADIAANNVQGESPLEMARVRRFQKIREILEWADVWATRRRP